MRLAWDCTTLARDELSDACDDCRADCALSTAVFAESKSACGRSFFSLSSLARANFCCESMSATFERSTSAWERVTSACALTRLARDCSTCAWNSDGSRRAITCPFFTIELKSAPSQAMLPDTWLPTCTVVTACSVPVEPTVSMISPRVTGCVLTCSSPVLRRM